MPNTQKKAPTLWSRIRTLVLVTFLALLVWLLAESRMVQTRTVELQLVLVGNNQDPAHQFVVRPAPNQIWDSFIELDLEGSLASLDQASRDLRGRVQLIVGDHIPTRTGTHDLDLRALLRQLPALRSHGVTIRALSKDIATVQVDEILSIELPVRVDLPSSVALDGPERAIPPTVTITGPSSQILTLEGREVFATPTPGLIRALTPDRNQTIPNVAVSLPSFLTDTATAPGWAPTVSPARVDVRLTIRSLTQTTTIDRLPIQILLAPGEVGRWNVTLNPGSEDLVSIQISGPTEALAAINDGTIVPSAVLSLSYQDLERAITTKQIALLGLPGGVEIISQLPEIGFTVSPALAPTQEPPTTNP